MFLLENFTIAIASLKSNKLRAFLTMLGIIIGISAVITIMTLGEIGKSNIGKQFEGVGANKIAIYLNWTSNSVKKDFLTDSDINKIRNVFKNEITYMSPVLMGDIGKAVKKKESGDVVMMGVNPDYKALEKVNVIKGRFLNESDLNKRRRVSVIDKKLALKLFKRVNVVGETLKIESANLKQSFTIIGIYEKKPQLFDAIFSKSTSVYIPIVFSNNDNEYDQLQLQISKDSEASLVSKKILKFIARIKGKENLYIAETAKNQIEIINNVLGTVSTGISIVAGISLLVGGIGIMNIMLVSVTERTKEIGIRKALGASRSDIVLQFLTESMIISAIGGIMGVIIGLSISTIIAIMLKASPVVPVWIVLIAVSFSAAVGISFGIYPANKAAELDPIEALRYE